MTAFLIKIYNFCSGMMKGELNWLGVQKTVSHFRFGVALILLAYSGANLLFKKNIIPSDYVFFVAAGFLLLYNFLFYNFLKRASFHYHLAFDLLFLTILVFIQKPFSPIPLLLAALYVPVAAFFLRLKPFIYVVLFLTVIFCSSFLKEAELSLQKFLEMTVILMLLYLIAGASLLLKKHTEQVFGSQLTYVSWVKQIAEELAYLDPLTGLLNRRGIQKHLEQLFQIHSQGKRELYFLFLDLDDFKKINDRYGHLYGDHILQEVARAIKDSVRKSDFVGRIGGDEFLVILPDCTSEASSAILNRIQESISSIKLKGRKTVKATMSFLCWDRKSTFSQILQELDEKVLAAKRAKKI